MLDTTSDMRTSICAAICGAVFKGTKEQKQWLSDLLYETPFEEMSDETLVGYAYQCVDPDLVTKLVNEKSHQHHPLRGHYLCPRCLDAHVIERGDGLWVKCPRCSVVQEPPL